MLKIDRSVLFFDSKYKITMPSTHSLIQSSVPTRFIHIHHNAHKQTTPPIQNEIWIKILHFFHNCNSLIVQCHTNYTNEKEWNHFLDPPPINTTSPIIVLHFLMFCFLFLVFYLFSCRLSVFTNKNNLNS